MVSQDEDSEKRVALFVIFGLVAAVVVGVLTFSVMRGGSVPKAAVATAPATLAIAPAAPLSGASGAAQANPDDASIKVEQGVVKFYFASGKADLAPGASEALADLVRGAQAGRKLVISGFHDATGDAAQNAELAKRRAMAVREALKTAGVTDEQIELKKPEQVEATGSDAEARRVEITLE